MSALQKAGALAWIADKLKQVAEAAEIAQNAADRLHVVSCGKQHRHWGIAGANGLAGRCLSLDMRR